MFKIKLIKHQKSRYVFGLFIIVLMSVLSMRLLNIQFSKELNEVGQVKGVGNYRKANANDFETNKFKTKIRKSINQQKSNFYKEQYEEDFVDNWDQLIDWNVRGKSESVFLSKNSLKEDIKNPQICCRGSHSIKLQQHNLEVHNADGSKKKYANKL